MTTVTWLVRYGHVLGAAVWVGGYALLALVIVPFMANGGANAAMARLAVTAVRVATYAGTATMLFGLVLIARTRGYDALFRGEWGGLVIACFVIAVALLGVGDGALRPALERLGVGGDGAAARRFALVGLILTIVAVGLMTRAVYART